MQLSTLAFILFIIVLVAIAAAVIAVGFFGGHQKTQVRDLLRGVLSSTMQKPKRKKLSDDDIETLKLKTAENRKQNQFSAVLFRTGRSNESRAKIESTRFFQAGLFTADDRRMYYYLQVFAPLLSLIISTVAMKALGASALLMTVGMVLGLFIGLTVPQSWIERKIKERNESIKYFLPMVIEQVAIGVSSSLDIWPCITQILDMARQRNTHNPVTELLLYVEKLITSGLNLQDALFEVGQASGVQQIKHTFRYLGMVAEHGGEISKQLQELADAVMTERQGDIEEIIHSLPVKATGPLFLVFTGFFILMLAGIFARLMLAFPE